MRYVCLVILLLTSCAREVSAPDPDLFARDVPESEWIKYEGQWVTKTGVRRIELSLINSTNNFNTSYKLAQFFNTAKGGSVKTKMGEFKSYDVPGGQSGIRLDGFDSITFIIRDHGSELILGDENFKPVSVDTKSTLHKVLNYFTVEGYVTFDGTSAEYYEKNTMQTWKLSELGEFEKVKELYHQEVTGKFDGVYLKALAFSIADSTTNNQQALVIKSIKTQNF